MNSYTIAWLFLVYLTALHTAVANFVAHIFVFYFAMYPFLLQYCREFFVFVFFNH